MTETTIKRLPTAVNKIMTANAVAFIKSTVFECHFEEKAILDVEVSLNLSGSIADEPKGPNITTAIWAEATYFHDHRTVIYLASCVGYSLGKDSIGILEIPHLFSDKFCAKV